MSALRSSRAVGVGLEKAVKEMLRFLAILKHGSEFACASIANRKS
jgi:hypothetical protein